MARRCALQVLYQSEILNKPADQVVEEGLVPEEAGMGDYARKLIYGVTSHKADLDRTISVSSQNWAIDRMPVVDRSILRLATFEVKYVDDVPVSVAINEAVELAKEFGGEDDSHRFVNGILGRIARDYESGEDAADLQPVAVEGADSAEVVEPAEAELSAAVEATADVETAEAPLVSDDETASEADCSAEQPDQAVS
ncbi:MAG: transcription antitermination factor NusB [Slackia sp.]|nr:transcription antitermination factor NusB [Slackia sp.]